MGACSGELTLKDDAPAARDSHSNFSSQPQTLPIFFNENSFYIFSVSPTYSEPEQCISKLSAFGCLGTLYVILLKYQLYSQLITISRHSVFTF